MPIPGEVYYLPPAPDEVVGKGDRPHAVVSAYPAQAETATLAYGSTRATEAEHGAAHVPVDPFARGFLSTGLAHPTYIYPSRLLSYGVDDLPLASGRIVGELPAILLQLRGALGMGAGVTTDANVRGANRRGRIVEYVSELAAELGTRYAVVVTEPDYSRQSRQQTTVPLLDPAEFESRPGDVFVKNPKAAGRVRSLSDLGAELIAAVPLILTVYEPHGILRYTAAVLSEEDMREIDTAFSAAYGF